MDQLKHFGIKTQFIRKDTKSYNLVRGTCEVCKKIADVSTQYSDSKDRDIKICDTCLDKHQEILRQQKGWGTPRGLI